jgi:hypothetical protein
MPNIDDVYNEIKGANTKLGTVVTELQTLTTVAQNVQMFEAYNAKALAHLSTQTDTVICLLEHIAKNTCGINNEADAQTALQKRITRATRTMAEILETVHAEAALDLKRLKKIRKRVEECCPAPKREPPCKYEPCSKPKALEAAPAEKKQKSG